MKVLTLKDTVNEFIKDGGVGPPGYTDAFSINISNQVLGMDRGRT